MARKKKKIISQRAVDALIHTDLRRNIPTAEFESLAQQMEARSPVSPIHYERSSPLEVGESRSRDQDLDPQLIWRGLKIRLTGDQLALLTEDGEVELGDTQLVWRGKDTQDWSDLVVTPPPIYIQEKIHPKAIIDDLILRSKERADQFEQTLDLFGDFNGLKDPEARLEFYQHDQHWTNRMILGDSLQVMATLAEREGLRGRVQCIYLDPPYGIKFNSNWQVSTQSRDVKDGRREDLSREPEQVKAFRDTWRDGIHSYMTYLRDRLTVARELLSATGSIFVQIGDENVHRVRALLDEVFGDGNFKSQIAVTKSTGLATAHGVINRVDYLVWYCRDINFAKVRPIYVDQDDPVASGYTNLDSDGRRFMSDNLTKPGPGQKYEVEFAGRTFTPGARWWGIPPKSMDRVRKAGRLVAGAKALRFKRYFDDYPYKALTNLWDGIPGAPDPAYVVQTHARIVERAILLCTDPGDLVLDPTCGSGTAAYVSEQWGRRWITIDTSRVALALARTRMMSAKYDHYFLSDSVEGKAKEQAVSGKIQGAEPSFGDIRHGFVYERVPHITLKSIANNSEIDVIFEEAQPTLNRLLTRINASLKKNWNEWDVPMLPDPLWPGEAVDIHSNWLSARIAVQKSIDASILRKAEVEILYDRPFEDKSRVRVAGPFTVESLSPHRVVPADEDEKFAFSSATKERKASGNGNVDFASMVLDHLRSSGVHQTNKVDRICFSSLTPWPGIYIAAIGNYLEGRVEKRAAIFIGPEFGTLSRTDLVIAAREASDAGLDVLVACAFNYDAHASELTRLGPMPILKARINPDMHMADDLKNTGRGNMFVIFGEPDLRIEALPKDPNLLQVQIFGVDVFDPQTGDIRSGDTKSIAAWFIDTNYNEESFFVRHAYFLGAQDPYKALKTTLRAEVDEDAWETLYRDVSRPFTRPASGRIAVKVINHFGDEVMKVFTV